MGENSIKRLLDLTASNTRTYVTFSKSQQLKNLYSAVKANNKEVKRGKQQREKAYLFCFLGASMVV